RNHREGFLDGGLRAAVLEAIAVGRGNHRGFCATGSNGGRLGKQRARCRGGNAGGGGRFDEVTTIQFASHGGQLLSRALGPTPSASLTMMHSRDLLRVARTHGRGRSR